ncbi:hypothetical protein FGO68_gene340 [Halteria grandinella]|uniref:Uncharacterized protein n=1 Tax=Halteria grandinella TaxID=5974 RepID=A0A8J8T5Z8_HALGN|nr:hypothetical protein FGO68_gene340 [Halteria grandinella]
MDCQSSATSLCHRSSTQSLLSESVSRVIDLLHKRINVELTIGRVQVLVWKAKLHLGKRGLGFSLDRIYIAVVKGVLEVIGWGVEGLNKVDG